MQSSQIHLSLSYNEIGFLFSIYFSLINTSGLKCSLAFESACFVIYLSEFRCLKKSNNSTEVVLLTRFIIKSNSSRSGISLFLVKTVGIFLEYSNSKSELKNLPHLCLIPPIWFSYFYFNFYLDILQAFS